MANRLKEKYLNEVVPSRLDNKHLLQIEVNPPLTIRSFLLKRILMVRGFLLYVDKACFRRKAYCFTTYKK